ncbi:hypothetical protein QTO31_00010 [Chloroflexus sp. MS-CIW-1]|uniref:hypothetical protein n=2 Tax=unclassified Chloroflexus TaxID=2633855 RepID=UPI001B00A2A0|nr:hypothetical protein [Chloroflexus sp. MS-CIW-1]MBO9347474.1 hypothetical protein [Chloroflexus sp.]MDN5270346.1 hypothetical protein [Chloroflexus sp. MS-CIW-1]
MTSAVRIVGGKWRFHPAPGDRGRVRDHPLMVLETRHSRCDRLWQQGSTGHGDDGHQTPGETLIAQIRVTAFISDPALHLFALLA